MPHKFNASRRHKFTKKKYRVTNWGAPRRGSRGGQPRYSDLAITMCLTLGTVYKLALRQTQGLMRSLARLMKLEIPVPDFSTLSRRGHCLPLPTRPGTERTEPIHLVMDSTGLKIFGEGEWLQEKYKTKAKRRSWRKLHLGLDLASGEIICSELTLDSVGDTIALSRLLDQIDVLVSHFLANGAYDGIPTNTLLRVRFGETVEIIIPPPKNATLSPKSSHDPTLRDRRITEIQARGRMAWQVSSGYNQRSRIETQMGRWKAVIGPKLKARCFENQKTEAKIGGAILNKMTELGRPVFEQIA